MLVRALAAFLLLLWLPSSITAETGRADEAIEYTVKQGDNLYTLADRYFVRTGDYRLVQRLNEIADPYRIPVGRVLHIPRQLLRYDLLEARIVAFRGAVQVVSGYRHAPARLGLPVTEGDRLATDANSFVTLRLPDQSLVSLPSNSLVEVRRLRKLLLTGSVDRAFVLVDGRTKATVTPMTDPGDSFRISTPVAASAVRGTQFRVSYRAELERGTTEVLQGQVGVDAGGTSELLPLGTGAVSSRGVVAAPRRLLPAPTLIRPARVQDDSRLLFEMESLDLAREYHVQIAQDAGFIDVIAETFSQEPRADLPPIDDGTWFVRVSALDGDGLEGMQETYAFERRLNTIDVGLDTRDAGGFKEYQFRWLVEGRGSHQYRFQLEHDLDGGGLLVDEPGLTAQRVVVTDLPPGTYRWRVQMLQFFDGKVFEKWSPFQRLTIASEK